MGTVVKFRPRPQIPPEAHRAVLRAHRYIILANALMAKAEALADAAGVPREGRATPQKPPKGAA